MRNEPIYWRIAAGAYVTTVPSASSDDRHVPVVERVGERERAVAGGARDGWLAGSSASAAARVQQGGLCVQVLVRRIRIASVGHRRRNDDWGANYRRRSRCRCQNVFVVPAGTSGTHDGVSRQCGRGSFSAYAYAVLTPAGAERRARDPSYGFRAASKLPDIDSESKSNSLRAPTDDRNRRVLRPSPRHDTQQ